MFPITNALANYCLLCSERGCDCSTHEEPILVNCSTCRTRKCKENPLSCKLKGLNMDYWKKNPVEFVEKVMNVKLETYQKQLLEGLFSE